MPKQTTLKLDFIDVYGNKLKDRLDISAQHMKLPSTSYRQRNWDASKTFIIEGIDFTQGGRYDLLIRGITHNTVHQFVQVFEEQETALIFQFPVRAEKVIGIHAPAYSALGKDLKDVLVASDIESFPGINGQALYQALDAPRKAGLLNIYAKMEATVFKLPAPRNTFSYVTALNRLRGDRFFARVTKDLRDEVKNSQAYKLFHRVPGGAHTPPPGYKLVDSYKTQEKYGNLQITFFSNPNTLEYIADVDIDDAQGIEHIFQVVDHFVTGNETNPYDIHEILIAYQKIDPGYKLQV